MDADADTFTVAVEEGNKAAGTYPGEQTFTIEDGYTKVGVGEVEKRASRTWWVSRSAADQGQHTRKDLPGAPSVGRDGQGWR